MNWILLAITVAILWGLYNFFIKMSSGEIDPVLGAVTLQITAATVSGILLLWMKISSKEIVFTHKGIEYAILAGVCVGLAEITYLKLFSRGIDLSIGMPIVVGGTIIVGVVLGLAILKEPLNFIHALSLLLIITGIMLLSTR